MNGVMILVLPMLFIAYVTYGSGSWLQTMGCGRLLRKTPSHDLMMEFDYIPAKRQFFRHHLLIAGAAPTPKSMDLFKEYLISQYYCDELLEEYFTVISSIIVSALRQRVKVKSLERLLEEIQDIDAKFFIFHGLYFLYLYFQQLLIFQIKTLLLYIPRYITESDL